jgi:hypothetical protein
VSITAERAAEPERLMDPHRAAELRAKRERLERLRRAKADAEAAHEAQFGRPQGSTAVPAGQLPAELEALFATALRHRVATEGSIDTMRRHIETGAVPLPGSLVWWSTCIWLRHLARVYVLQAAFRQNITLRCGVTDWA